MSLSVCVYNCLYYGRDLQLVDGDPRVGRKFLQHRNKELQTAVPMSDQQHHADEVEYPHEHSGNAQKLITQQRRTSLL